MSDHIETITNRYHHVLDRLNRATTHSGRSSDTVKLLVVSKGQPAERIIEAYHAGACLFGENYPDETAGKLDKIQSLAGLEIHMIGHLQSRKARIVAGSFHYMHSIDRVSIAEKLNRELIEAGRKIPVLLEMNVSGEETKGGFAAWDRSMWDAILAEISQIAAFESLQIRGLMTMPPLTVTPNEVRPYFARLRDLRDYFAKQFPTQHWTELSMGTSADFEMAIQEGATFIRVGTAIMGTRPAKNSE
jgi:pyridoxal phosphate enzyme (YggS family)